MSEWVSAHVADADRLGKPLVLEEFGFSAFPEARRASFFNAALNAMEAAASRGRSACGSAFWAMYSDDDRARTSADQYAVFAGDAVMARMGTHAARLEATRRATDAC